MPTDAIKNNVQSAYRSISKRMPNFKNRYTQRVFIAEIVKTLYQEKQDQRILVTEGPTGTGKTLAYLVASIPAAKQLYKKLIISSATVALQTQLIERDIPLIQKMSGMAFTYIIAKGRGRYLCPSLLSQNIGEDGQQIEAFASNDYLSSILKEFHHQFETGEWDGDKDTWEETISDEVWTKISNDRHGCLAARCDYFRSCPYFVAKGKIEEADVIVANHDLVLSDLALGGGILLPKPEDTIYVFDEAHHLPDKTINHASTWGSTSGTTTWLNRTEGLIKQIEALLMEQSTANLFSLIDKALKHLKSDLSYLNTYLNSLPDLQTIDNSEISYRFPQGLIPSELRSLCGACFDSTQEAYKQCKKLKDKMTREVTDGNITSKQAEAVLPELGIVLQRLENLHSLWAIFILQDPKGAPPTARWITKSIFKEHVDFKLHTSPISAADFLCENLWQKCYGSILTSATLISLGSFGYFQSKSGLQHMPDTNYLQLASPFDFANNATLWLPWMENEPQNASQHTEEIIRLLPDLVSKENGSLILFSSRKQLLDVSEQLPDHIKEILLIQGDYNIQTLLEKHNQQISQGNASIIMGLASFAEGIDLPGRLCTDVIIAKLPFPVPDSPVEATEREYLEAQGKSHFQEIVLPQTCIRLIQSVGRLIRSETDTGKITILDRRLITKSYGKKFLQALPNMRRIIEYGP